jgi:hypothetical protein
MPPQVPRLMHSGLTITIGQNGSGGNKATRHDKLSPFVDRQHRMACGKRNDLIAPAIKQAPELDA